MNPKTMNHFTVVLEPDEGGFHAYVPALPGCHSWGTSPDDASANIAEAIALHVEAMRNDGEPIPNDPKPLVIPPPA